MFNIRGMGIALLSHNYATHTHTHFVTATLIPWSNKHMHCHAFTKSVRKQTWLYTCRAIQSDIVLLPTSKLPLSNALLVVKRCFALLVNLVKHLLLLINVHRYPVVNEGATVRISIFPTVGMGSRFEPRNSSLPMVVSSSL